MVVCPSCGHEFKARAAIGEGTQKGRLMRSNANRSIILAAMRSLRAQKKFAVGVQDVLAEIQRRGVRRESKRGTGWNYHTVQADMSILLAQGAIEMVEDILGVFDGEDGHQTNKIPRYKVNL